MFDAFGQSLRFGLSLVSAPAAEPITTAVAKLHLRVDHETDDALIDTLCAAAREYVEARTQRKLITQTWDLKLDRFPVRGQWNREMHVPTITRHPAAIVLPLLPVASVTSVTYVADSGASTVLDSGLYTTDILAGSDASPVRIVPAYEQVWPSTRPVINAVAVRFVCGYGTAGTLVPGGLLAAMKLLIGHWYAHRESVVVATVSQELQQGVDALISQYRVF